MGQRDRPLYTQSAPPQGSRARPLECFEIPVEMGWQPAGVIDHGVSESLDLIEKRDRPVPLPGTPNRPFRNERPRLDSDPGQEIENLFRASSSEATATHNARHHRVVRIIGQPGVDGDPRRVVRVEPGLPLARPNRRRADILCLPAQPPASRVARARRSRARGGERAM